MTFTPKPQKMLDLDIGSMIDFERDGYALLEAIEIAKPKRF